MSHPEAQRWQRMLAASWEPSQWFDDEDSPLRRGDDHWRPEGNRIMWVYRKTEESVFTVGYYTPKGDWVTESDWPTPGEAAQRVRWLNGGND